jgi:Eukaryotic-type carbonic anhydrase.
MYKLKKRKFYQAIAKTVVFASVITMMPEVDLSAYAVTDANILSNQYFNVKIGEYGEINSLKLVGDEFDTNYVLNGTNAPTQGASSEHQWMGELMFQTKKAGDSNWTESMTSASAKDSTARKITKNGNKITVTYENENIDKGIKDFKLEETYELVDNHLKWSMKVTNPDA